MRLAPGRRPLSLGMLTALVAAAAACGDEGVTAPDASAARAAVPGRDTGAGAPRPPAPPAPAGRDTSAAPRDLPADPSDVADVPGVVLAPGFPAAPGDSAGTPGRVPGVTVRALRGPSGEEVARVTTGADGAFAFRALARGFYTFEVTPPPGSALQPARLPGMLVLGGRFGFPGPWVAGVPTVPSPFVSLTLVLRPAR